MESTSLYRTLVQVLSCHQNWLDLRHLKTLAWMMSGLILSREIGLGSWAIYVHSRAQYVASTIRRFRRFLDNDRIDVARLYTPLLHQALQGWHHSTVYVALDTSMLWNRYCLVRLSLIYRGRAIPLVWKVLEHGSATVAYEDYHTLLDQAAQLLFSYHCNVIFLADRGFADTTLMRHLQQVGWHFRIRIKDNFWIYRKGQPDRKTGDLRLRAGHPRFWHEVEITDAVCRFMRQVRRWYPTQKVWIVLDQDRAHPCKCRQTRRLMRKLKLRWISLPKGSPDDNPVENIFSDIQLMILDNSDDPDEKATQRRISAHLRGRNRRKDRYVRIPYIPDSPKK